MFAPPSKVNLAESRPPGVPFHPEQEAPSAPCPLCCKNNDARPKKLLFINGTSKGEYDNEIPDSYFDIPPPQINGPEKGAEGLRFQYLSLIRYSTTMFEKLHKWEARQPEIIRQLDKLRSYRQELVVARSQLSALQQNTSSLDAVLAHEGPSPVKTSNKPPSPEENKKASGPVPNNSLTARETIRPNTMDPEAADRQESIPPINLARERPIADVRSSLESDNCEQTRYVGRADKLHDADRSGILDQGSTIKQKRRKIESPASTRLPSTNQSVRDPTHYWELPLPSYCRPPIVRARTLTDDLPSAFQGRVVKDAGATSYHALESATRAPQAGPRNYAHVSAMLNNGSEQMKVPRSSHATYHTPCHRGMTWRNGFPSRVAPYQLPNVTQAPNRNPLPPDINFNGYGNRTPHDSELQPLGLHSSYERMRTWSSSRSYQGFSAHGSGSLNFMRSGDRRLGVSSAQTPHNMICRRGDRPDHNWPPA